MVLSARVPETYTQTNKNKEKINKYETNKSENRTHTHRMYTDE